MELISLSRLAPRKFGAKLGNQSFKPARCSDVLEKEIKVGLNKRTPTKRKPEKQMRRQGSPGKHKTGISKGGEIMNEK